MGKSTVRVAGIKLPGTTYSGDTMIMKVVLPTRGSALALLVSWHVYGQWRLSGSVTWGFKLHLERRPMADCTFLH